MKDLTAYKTEIYCKYGLGKLFTLSKIFKRQLHYWLLYGPIYIYIENQINLGGNTKLEMASFTVNCKNVLQSPIYGKTRQHNRSSSERIIHLLSLCRIVICLPLHQ